MAAKRNIILGHLMFICRFASPVSRPKVSPTCVFSMKHAPRSEMNPWVSTKRLLHFWPTRNRENQKKENHEDKKEKRNHADQKVENQPTFTLTDNQFKRIKILGFFNSMKRKGGISEMIYEAFDVAAILCSVTSIPTAVFLISVKAIWYCSAAVIEGMLHSEDFENMLVKDFYTYYVEKLLLKDFRVMNRPAFVHVVVRPLMEKTPEVAVVGYVLKVKGILKENPHNFVRLQCELPIHNYVGLRAGAKMMTTGELLIYLPFNDGKDAPRGSLEFSVVVGKSKLF